MELMKNLRWMCRVCAVNIKKRRSAFSAKPIFGTPQLMEKLRKYLDMDLEIDDHLPTTICGNCYKRLESVHNFALLAKKTENFLKDFINIAQNQLKGAQSSEALVYYPNELNSFFPPNIDKDQIIYNGPQQLHQSQTTSQTTQYGTSKTNSGGDVVLNFTLNNPLTKSIPTNLLRSIPPSEMNIQKKHKTEYVNTTNISNNNNNNNINNSNDNNSCMLTSQNSTNPLINRSPNLIAEQTNSLEQKRQNLKMVLVNNNVQAAIQANSMLSNQMQQQRQFLSSNNILSHQQQQQQQMQSSHQPQEFQQQIGMFQQNFKNDAVVYDCLNLGCVIKDMDLLKLILKALKWPYTHDTLSGQINRLKNTRFRDVMLDPNLLQDTDLMKILSTYLSPILLQQTQNVMPQNVLPTVVSYKIPADTSVHLVTVPTEELTPPPPPPLLKKKMISTIQKSHTIPKIGGLKKSRHMKPPPLMKKSTLMKPRSLPATLSIRNSSPIEILSDSENEEVQMFEVSIDPTVYFPQYGEIQDSSNESLIINLVNNKQNKDITENSMNRIRRKQKRKEAHIKLHTDKESTLPIPTEIVKKPDNKVDASTSGIEQVQPIVMDTTKKVSTTNLLTVEKKKQEQIETKISKNKDDNNTITIIDDISNDDAIWAEFKVIESPDHSGIEEQNIKNNIKKELLSQIETTKREEIDDKPSEEAIEIDINKQLPPAEELVSSSTNTLMKTRKYRKKKDLLKTDNTAIINSAEELKKEISSTKEDNQLKQSSSILRNSKNKDKNVIPVMTGTRQSKRKLPLNVDTNQRNKKIKKRSQISAPERRERKSKLCSKYYVHPNERTPKTRNRICKQCGFTFNNLLDFVNHRKTHM